MPNNLFEDEKAIVYLILHHLKQEVTVDLQRSVRKQRKDESKSEKSRSISEIERRKRENERFVTAELTVFC